MTAPIGYGASIPVNVTIDPIDPEILAMSRAMGAAMNRHMRDLVVKVADDHGLTGEERAEFIKQALSAQIFVGSGGRNGVASGEMVQFGPTIEEARKL